VQSSQYVLSILQLYFSSDLVSFSSCPSFYSHSSYFPLFWPILHLSQYSCQPFTAHILKVSIFVERPSPLCYDFAAYSLPQSIYSVFLYVPPVFKVRYYDEIVRPYLDPFVCNFFWI
jgi:hypothetical protein